MNLDAQMRAFLEKHHSAAMTTLRADGTPHVARVGVALVDGKMWSSGTQIRIRTKHLRRDPRSTLFVFDAEFRWLGLESRVTILDGPDAPELNLRLFQVMQQGMGVPDGQIMCVVRMVGEEESLQRMVEVQRVMSDFESIR